MNSAFSSTSRSGRVRHHQLGSVGWLLAVLLATVLFVSIVASLYTLALHLILGDRGNFDATTGREFGRIVEKWAQDNVAAVQNVLWAQEIRAQSPLPSVHLTVAPGQFASLDQDILRYGLGQIPVKPKIAGLLADDSGDLHPVRVGYRGTNTWHHQYWKPSLQVRLRGDKTMDGFREQILIAPEDPTGLRNWLSSSLAGRLSVINNQEEFVRLFLNGRYLGLYTRVRPMDDTLIAFLGLPPGPVFRAEAMTGPVFRRTLLEFFRPEDWETLGWDLVADQAILAELLAAVRLSPRESSSRLDRLVDRRAFARYLAVLAHAADVHTDDHNFALYFDRTSGRFFPINVDVNGYDWSHRGYLDRPVVFAGNAVIRAWLRDPRNLAAYVEELWRFLRAEGSVASVHRLIDDTWARVRPDAMADVNTSEMGARSLTYARTLFPLPELDVDVEALKAVVQTRVEFLNARLQADRVVLLDRGTGDFEILVFGVAGVRVRRGGASERTLLPSTSSREDSETPLSFVFTRLEGSPSEYRFFHRLTGAEVPLSDETIEAPILDSLRRSVGLTAEATEAEPLVIEISGVRDLDEDLVLNPKDRLVVAPGSVIRLGSRVSVLLRGASLEALGTAEAPITFEAQDPQRPFGVIALNDGATARLAHVRVRGGSRKMIAGVSYQAPLSVHFAEAEIKDSQFEGAMISARWARIRLENCTYSGPSPRLLDELESRVVTENVQRAGPAVVLAAARATEPSFGTPARQEQEFKHSIAVHKDRLLDVEALAREVLSELEIRLREKAGFSAPSFTGVPYFVDPRAIDLLFRDIYFDTLDALLERHQVSYRVRHRWRSASSYSRHLEHPRWTQDWPHRVDFQAKVDRTERGGGLSSVREGRLEFLRSMPPFNEAHYPPPDPPWPVDVYAEYFVDGRFEGRVAESARTLLEFLAAKGEIRDSYALVPKVVIVTERIRQHLNMLTRWGWGPDPEQAFIISFDRSDVFPAAEYVAYLKDPSLGRPDRLARLFEVEVEFERNVSFRLDEEINAGQARGDEPEVAKLEAVRGAFLSDQERILETIGRVVKRYGARLEPASESKYLQAVRGAAEGS